MTGSDDSAAKTQWALCIVTVVPVAIDELKSVWKIMAL